MASTSTRGIAVAAGLATIAVAAAGCGVVSAVNHAVSAVQHSRSIIHTFTSNLKSAPTTFEARYATTGAAPATIVYAVRPPHDVTFRERSTGGSTGAGSLDLIVNSSGEYACTPPPGGGWACQRLGTASAATRNKIFDFYTPGHWVDFLRGFSLAAGLAGDKVSASSMTLNGFRMSCVDFRAPGIPGTSRICTAAQGILGYVKVASAPTSFELKSYTTSPPASLFRLPPGAKLTSKPKQ
jgi:hypothetical protein